MSPAARPLGPVRLAWVAGALWVLAQICYPLVGGATRDVVTVTVVLLGALAGVLHAMGTRGWAWTLWLVVVTAVGGFAVELLGTVSGFPFGHYDYSGGRLGPAVAGVPLLIGVAWTAGAYPAWCAAGRVAPARRGLRWALAAVGLAGWDLYLDPQMVTDGLWVWRAGAPGLPGVPEVPWTNYVGWLGVAAVMAALLATGPRPAPRDRPVAGDGFALPDALPVAVYCWTWLGSLLAHAVFLDLRASALYGAVGMGLLGVPLLASLQRGALKRVPLLAG